MFKQFICLILLLLPLMANASGCQYSFEIYRSKQLAVEKVQAAIKEELEGICNITVAPDAGNEDKYKSIKSTIKRRIDDVIHHMGLFDYVNVSTVINQNDRVVHITLDVVDRSDKARLQKFHPKPSETINGANKLIVAMQHYLKMGMNQMLNEKLFPVAEPCPVFHCLFGFSGKTLGYYLTVFNQGALKNKAILFNILRNDVDPEKRKAAAYLLAHIPDGKELVQQLSYSIKDPDAGVRNAVMRVLGAALLKVKVEEFPVDDVIAALDFPAETDRNKALFVLYALTQHNKQYNAYILKHANHLLQINLRSNQPNLSHNAYAILRALSDA